MDTLKSLPFTIAVCLIGAVLVVLAATGKITLGGNAIEVDSAWWRGALAVLGLSAIAVGVWLEVRKHADSANVPGSKKDPVASTTPLAAPGNVFFTLDDRPTGSFADLVANASRVQLLARTAVNLISQYGKTLEALGRQGCDIQVLMVDPRSDAARFLYGGGIDVYRNNVVSAAQHLKALKTTLGARLQVRVTKHAPTFGLVVSHHSDPALSHVQVQIYFLHSAVGRDRPLFRLKHGERGFSVYVEEFDKLWKESTDWDMTDFLNTIATRPARGLRRQPAPSCPFCEPSIRRAAFAESSEFMAIYNIAPILPGHSLVVPKWHVQSLMDLSDAELSEMMVFSRETAQVLSDAFSSQAFNWTIQEGEQAGQTVRHLHLHLIPRRRNDLPAPGDWYPILKAQESSMIDSAARPRLTAAKMETIVARIRQSSKRLKMSVPSDS